MGCFSFFPRLESKDKKRLREKLSAVMNQIQQALAANKGIEPGHLQPIVLAENKRMTFTPIAAEIAEAFQR
jgi:hypothetical protein